MSASPSPWTKENQTPNSFSTEQFTTGTARVTQEQAERDLQWSEPFQPLPKWLEMHFGHVTLVKQRGGNSLCTGMWIFCTLSALEFCVCLEKYFHWAISYFLAEGVHLASNLQLFCSYHCREKIGLFLRTVSIWECILLYDEFSDLWQPRRL